jgi:hypothetical protein
MVHIVFTIYSIIGDYYHLKLHHIWVNMNTFDWKKAKIIFELTINIKINKGNRFGGTNSMQHWFNVIRGHVQLLFLNLSISLLSSI